MNSTWHNISPGETITVKRNLSSYQKPTLDNHTITTGTTGAYVKFNYTRNISLTSSDHIPKPYISDVELGTTTFRGSEKAVVHVTVKNPTIHTYPLVLIAHTTETNGHQAAAGTSQGDSTTNTILLNESPSEIVVGEIRLNMGDPGSRDEAFDQVEINGTVGGDVAVSDEPYVPVTPPWERNSYRYENESVVGDGRPDPLPLPWGLEWTTVWSAVAVLVVLRFAGRRIRR